MYKLVAVKPRVQAGACNCFVNSGFILKTEAVPFLCEDVPVLYQHTANANQYDGGGAIAGTHVIETVTFGGVSYDVQPSNLTVADIQDLEGLLLGLTNVEGTYWYDEQLNPQYGETNSFEWTGTNIVSTVIGQFDSLTIVTDSGVLTFTSKSNQASVATYEIALETVQEIKVNGTVYALSQQFVAGTDLASALETELNGLGVAATFTCSDLTTPDRYLISYVGAQNVVAETLYAPQTGQNFQAGNFVSSVIVWS